MLLNVLMSKVVTVIAKAVALFPGADAFFEKANALCEQVTTLFYICVVGLGALIGIVLGLFILGGIGEGMSDWYWLTYFRNNGD